MKHPLTRTLSTQNMPMRVQVRHAVSFILVLSILATAGIVAWAARSPVGAVEPQLREFTLTASQIDWELQPGTQVKAWAYNGQVPGPEIRVREGDHVRITLVNHLPVG